MLITMNSTRRGKILFLKSNITTAKYNLISYFTRMIVTKAWQYLPYFFWIHQWTLSGMVAKDSFESVFNKMLNPTMTGGGERGSKWTATEKMTKKEKIVHMKSTSRPTHCPPPHYPSFHYKYACGGSLWKNFHLLSSNAQVLVKKTLKNAVVEGLENK